MAQSRARPPRPAIQLGSDFEAVWPGASTLATEIALNLGLLSARFAAYVQAHVRRYGIPSLAAFNVLAILEGAGQPLPPSAIAERIVITRGTLTGILDSLERRDLVKRMRHGMDGRMRLVTLTDAGRDCLRAARPTLHRTERRWLDSLTAEQQQLLLQMLAVLQAHLPTPPAHKSAAAAAAPPAAER